MNQNIEDDIVYAEADSQEDTIEQLLQDLDENNGSWSPLFPTEVENEAYDPWLPEMDGPSDTEILASIPIDTICRYIGQTSRRNVAERDIARQEHANIQADFVEEVSQRLETERRANFLQRQLSSAEKENIELRKQNIDHEEREARQLDLVMVIERKHQQELAQKDEEITALTEQVRKWMSSAIEFQERDNRQLEYLNQAESRYWTELSMMAERVRELESRKINSEQLKKWARRRSTKAKKVSPKC